MKKIVIFDGECGFCNKIILFLAQKDIDNSIVFISNKSNKGRKLISFYNIDNDLPSKTLILIHKESIYIKSDVFKILSETNENLLFLKLVLKIFPKYINDFFYKIISKNRKKIIKNNCQIPSKNIREKIIL
ncbi:thiol-disulfide oxidoreductase DCC family protein [Empedobacter brevis]|uniref:thiol-disulfide oxidoreductase DCC family protein n=1 Tax=Empedobacter brevis TaxID=247 RepID=UPI003A5C8717